LCGGWEHCRPDYVMQRRTFRYRSIEFVAEGSGELRLSGDQHTLVPGMAFSYGPGIHHRIRTNPADVMTKYFIDFTGTEADALIGDTILHGGPVQVSEPYRVRTVLDDLQRHAGDTGPRREAICILLLRLLLFTIDSLAIRSPGVHPRAAHSYARCKQFIDEQFLALHSLADVTNACHMDPATICRLFKRFGELSPYQYLLRCKMQYAAERLQSEDRLVKEVADEMGFSDPYHFTRSFKRVHGISPQRLLELTRRDEGKV